MIVYDHQQHPADFRAFSSTIVKSAQPFLRRDSLSSLAVDARGVLSYIYVSYG